MISLGLDVSALDVTFKAHAGRGIGRYVGALAGSFREQFSAIDEGRGSLHSLERGAKRGEVALGTFTHRDFSLPAWGEKLIESLPAGRQTVRQQLCYPLQLGRRGKTSQFDVLHFPAHMDAPSWSTVPYIVTVLDLIPLVCADLYQAEVAGWRFKLARWLELRAIRGAAMILAISECTARDVERLLHIPAERIRVTPLGVDQVFFQEPNFFESEQAKIRHGISAQRPLIGYVGGIDARKNVPQLVKIFSQVLSSWSESDRVRPLLFISGRIESDRNYPALVSLIKELGITEDVVLPGFVPDADLRAIVQSTHIFVFPSLYEGFGLPPLEAMALGTPVMSQNNSSLPEVLGDSAHWFDAQDIEGSSSLLKGLLQNESLRLSKVAAGRQQAAQFTWDRMASLTYSAYEEYATIVR
jgi:glycosyltransferase involved in cell wall biosynthesis